MCYFVITRTSLVNKGQYVLHKWSLNASDMATTRIGIGVYKINIFLFGERILLDFGTLVRLSNSY